MTSTRRRTAAALALAAAVSLATTTGAAAAPKPKAPPAAVATVLPQVHLRVNSVPATPTAGDFTAVVTVKAPANAPVTGTYQLLDGGVVLAEGTLVGGSGVATLDLAPGSHTLVAVYSGSAKVNGAGTKVVEVAVPAA